MDFSDPKTTWKVTAHRQQKEAVLLGWFHPVQEAGKDSQKLQEEPAWESRGVPEQNGGPKGPVGSTGSVPVWENKVQVSSLHCNETASTLTAATNPNSVSEHQLQRLYQAQRWPRAAASSDHQFRCL